MREPTTPLGGTCPSCGSSDLRPFHEQRGIPVNSCLLVDDRRAALEFPTGDLRLDLCRSCGFVFNALFEPQRAEYSPRYEETQGFSPHFRRFARDVAQGWIDRYDLRGRDILEIGCGKGEFLALMCELGANRGIGIDPGYRPDRMDSPAASRMRFIADFYGPAYAELTGDAVVCRHTLEHIGPVAAFLRLVRDGLDPERTVVLFELPDTMRVLREAAFWDVYYEHCSYFTAGSLARLFRATGFDVLDVATVYGDQYLLLDARPGPASAPLPAEETPAEVEAAADHFALAVDATVAAWRSVLRGDAAAGRRAVIWGAGSKGVAFLTAVGGQQVSYAVDVNPHKQGKYMPGTGHLVVAPEFLKGYRPDVVIAMNAEYQAEIAAALEALGVDAELRVL